MKIVHYIYVRYRSRLFGQDGWILAKLFFAFFMDQDKVEVHKNAKKEQGQYPAMLTEQAWSIKDLLYRQKITPKEFRFCGTNADNHEQAR